MRAAGEILADRCVPSTTLASVTAGCRAAAAVAGRAGLGAGALRPDRDALQRVEARDRAAAGADLDHLDHGMRTGRPAALQEARGAVDLEQPRGVRLEVVDQADLGRGAAHVEASARVLAGAGRHLRRKDRAAGRARFDQPHREAPRRLDRGEAAARGHEVDRAAESRPRAPSACARGSSPSAAAHRRWRPRSRCARTRASPGRPRWTA